MIKKKVLFLHYFWFHYEMIGSLLEQFKEYEIHIYISMKTSDWENWRILYRELNIPFYMIDEIVDTNYDLVVLDTDDDNNMCSLYNYKLKGIPIYVINHIKSGNRSKVPNEYKYEIDIHGIQKHNSPFHFCGYNFIKTPEDKLKKLSNKISVAIIGDVVNEERNYLETLKNRFTNFDDIDFYIINRSEPYWKTNEYPNIKYFININAILMMKILEKCHYVYYFALKRGTETCSACVGMAYSTLNRLLCWEPKKYQYEIETPIFASFDEKITLKPLLKIDIEAVKNERDLLINKTQESIKQLLKS